MLQHALPITICFTEHIYPETVTDEKYISIITDAIKVLLYFMSYSNYGTLVISYKPLQVIENNQRSYPIQYSGIR